jgi:hypothetical protein
MAGTENTNRAVFGLDGVTGMLIATVLLVIVAVVSVVSFMSWFNSQSSELQAKASVEADGIGRELQVYVGGDGKIYLTNVGTKVISVTAVAASV